MTDKNKEIHHSEFDDRELEVTEFDLEGFEISEFEWREVEKEITKPDVKDFLKGLKNR